MVISINWFKIWFKNNYSPNLFISISKIQNRLNVRIKPKSLIRFICIQICPSCAVKWQKEKMWKYERNTDVSGFFSCCAYLQRCISENRLMCLSLRLHGWRGHHKDCKRRLEWRRHSVKNGGNKQHCTWGSDSGDHRGDSSITAREKHSQSTTASAKQNIIHTNAPETSLKDWLGLSAK